MLTDEKLTELFRYSFGLIDSRMTPNQQAFCRLIESAACAERDARIAEQDELIARLRLEAQLHAQEARTANATIAEIYQVVTGSTGEPGNWHGAAPVKSRIAELTRELEEARKDAMNEAASICDRLDAEVDKYPAACAKAIREAVGGEAASQSDRLVLVPIEIDDCDEIVEAACNAGNLYRVDFIRAWQAAIRAAIKEQT